MVREDSGGKVFGKVADIDKKYLKIKESPELKSVLKSWLRKKSAKCTCKRIVLSNVPILSSMRSYRPLKDLPGDIIAGLTVGVMHIPQGMAFAALASLPPIVGLYVAFISTLIYFFIGGSRQASMGVVAVTCLMLGSVLDRELPPNDVTNSDDDSNATKLNMTGISDEKYAAQRVQLAAAISFLSGIFLIVLGKVGCGFVTTYMPDALVRGFTTGAATHVVIGQMKNVLGIQIPRHNGPLKAIMTVIELCKNLPDVNWMPLVISLVSMAIMYVVRVHINQRYSKKLKIPIPIELIVMIISIVMSKYSDLPTDYSLKIVGEIPTGIPEPTLPDLSLAKSSASDAFMIGIVAFTQSVALAKTFAVKNGYKVDSNQEMFSYGVCTLVSSLFSGIVAAASMARSTVQDSTGGKSQIASIIGSAIVLMVILFLGPLFYNLPLCILSSVIIVNLRGMFRQCLLLKPYWKQTKPDMIIFLGTFLAVVIIDVDIGLGIGVGVAVFSVIVRTQTASFVELGQIENQEMFKPVNLYNQAFTNSTTKVLKFGSPLYFANAEIFQKRVYKLLALNIDKLKKVRLNASENGLPLSYVNGALQEDQPQNGATKPETWTTSSADNLRHVILDMSGTTFIDTMGAAVLKNVIIDLKTVDIILYVVGLPETAYHVLRTTDVWEKCSDHFYLSITDIRHDLNCFTVHL